MAMLVATPKNARHLEKKENDPTWIFRDVRPLLTLDPKEDLKRGASFSLERITLSKRYLKKQTS